MHFTSIFTISNSGRINVTFGYLGILIKLIKINIKKRTDEIEFFSDIEPELNLIK